MPPLLLTCLWGFRQQETRDCKGIEILLGTCPSSHWSEDLPPYPEVFWSLRRSPASFLRACVFAALVSSLLGFLSLPLRWVSLGLASTSEVFTKSGSCCAWPPPVGPELRLFQPRLNSRNGTIDVGGVCNLLSSVLSQQKVEAVDQRDGPPMDQCYSSVLQLNFI